MKLPSSQALSKDKWWESQPQKASYQRVGEEGILGMGPGGVSESSLLQKRKATPKSACTRLFSGRQGPSITCFLYIHGSTCFRGVPVPPGDRRLPLRGLLFFCPLTLALAPLVPQGLLPRHNQNPRCRGAVESGATGAGRSGDRVWRAQGLQEAGTALSPLCL